MTAHPIDTEALRARAEHVYRHGGPANAVESLAANVPEILDRLAAAERRATRAEAERDCRRRENDELRDELVATQEYGAKLAHGKDEAEERIKAVRDALSFADMGETLVTRSRIRRALDGDA